jgi:hypothetical protein
VVIAKASFALVPLFHLALGTLYLTSRLPLPVAVQLGLGLTMGLIALGLVGFVATQRYGLLSKLLGWLSGFNRGRTRLERWRQHLSPTDAVLSLRYCVYTEVDFSLLRPCCWRRSRAVITTQAPANR